MKRGVTIKDIAERLNMSVSTVSKSLNDDPSISQLTKERVRKLANDWNYIPNEAARRFKLSKTFTLGLIIPDMMDQFYVQAINGAEKIAGQKKYNVIITQSQEDPAREENIIDLMKRNRVDGLIVAMTKNREDMEPFKKMEAIGIPVVFIARRPKGDSFDHVTSDNEGGAFLATEYLIKKGHKNIGHIMGPESMAVSHTRLAGYKRALEKYSIPFHADLVKSVDLTSESTVIVMSEFMKMGDIPTAFFTFKNYISLDAIEYLKKHHPDKINQIDFAGFGNLPLFQYLDKKPIASIEENSYEMGEKAATMLFEIIKEQQELEGREARHVQVECKLLVYCLFLLLFLSIVMTTSAQQPDSTSTKVPASWKRFHIAPRVAVGIQKSFYTEVGLCLQKFAYDARRGFAATAIYTAFEWILSSAKKGNAIYGVKLGYESVFNGGTGAIEVKYLTNKDDYDVMITPKIGFGIGLLSLLYGYNFSTNKYPLGRIGKHQFSLAVNTNILFHQDKYDRKYP